MSDEKLSAILDWPFDADGNLTIDDFHILAEQAKELEAENKALQTFYPDAEHINALPTRLKDWVMNLETEADPAGTIQRACAAELDRDEARLAVASFKVEVEVLRKKVATVEVSEYKNLRAIEMVTRRIHQTDKDSPAGTLLDVLSLGNALESIDKLRAARETSE